VEQLMKFGTIILAAGASRRMGVPKVLLPWGATSVLGHLIGLWQKLGAEQVAVVHAANRAIEAELDRLAFPIHNRILNPAPERGMFSSIQCAANWPGWKPHLTHWLITLGDQPHLRAQTLQALLDFGAAHPGRICQPGRQGRPRHPVLLPNDAFAQLRDSPAAHLQDFLQAQPGQSAAFESDDPGLDLDLDYSADYQQAISQLFQRIRD
jgi:molybdenum cofactor cytidylyltransferase